jgi:predicted transcriptional regulator
MSGTRTELPKAAMALELKDTLGLSERRIAAQVGLTSSTVHSILAGNHGWDVLAELPIVKRHRAQQNAALEQAARTLAAQSFIRAAEDLPNASYYQAVTGGAILIDKARLLAGESTANVEVHSKVEVTGLDNLCSALSQVLLESTVSQSQTGSSVTDTST